MPGERGAGYRGRGYSYGGVNPPCSVHCILICFPSVSESHVVLMAAVVLLFNLLHCPCISVQFTLTHESLRSRCINAMFYLSEDNLRRNKRSKIAHAPRSRIHIMTYNIFVSRHQVAPFGTLRL